MTHATAVQQKGKKLNERDAVGILGAVLFYLCEKQVCTTLADANANWSAQGQILKLREEVYRLAYRS